MLKEVYRFVKLLNFIADGHACFGMAVGEYAVSFAALHRHEKKDYTDLESISTYLENLPESFEHASDLAERGSGLMETDNA